MACLFVLTEDTYRNLDKFSSINWVKRRKTAQASLAFTIVQYTLLFHVREFAVRLLSAE